MRPRLTSTTAGLAIGITAAVAIACAAGAYFYSVHHFQTLIENERRTALAQGELMRAALEHQMIENDRSLIERLVQTFGKEPGVANVTLLDRMGAVRYSSAPVGPPAEFQLSSPTCQACHQFPPEHRSSSRIIDTRGGTMLRTVIPFRNGPACQRCHDRSHRINGIMILDLDAGELRASMNRDLRWLVGGTGTLALVLIAAIALVFRVFVMRRLQRFEHTARLIAAGDLERRVPTDGADTISWLATEFNTMADSMTGLVTEVRSQRERLETVINSMDDGIVVLDARRRVIAANDGFLRRSGRGRPEALGCFCKDLAPGTCTAEDCPTLACLTTGERQVRICERHTADGQVRWEEVHASPVRGPSGELMQIVEVWRDISDRRAAEARLADSHRLASLGVLASGFSHELNTPLATVLMCVEGILRDSREHANDEQWTRIGESASIAREQILRCKGITQHFLRLSRGQPAAGDIIDVQPVMASVARLIEPTARAHNVTIEASAAAGPVHVRADESELQHAVINLLLNAVQACGPSGHVTLSAVNGSTVVVRVSDNGCGIAPEHQKRIFEPFFSLRKGGTGLGLFLALNFVRRWGGDIVVESSPGHGSTFEVRLPRVAQ
ncbi:MAG TPA: ATP-binding protein [Gemmatimonadaceae bacterium]|nr:ATP-binding protein [Gemmatimonadaceae bacterium]